MNLGTMRCFKCGTPMSAGGPVYCGICRTEKAIGEQSRSSNYGVDPSIVRDLLYVIQNQTYSNDSTNNTVTVSQTHTNIQRRRYVADGIYDHSVLRQRWKRQERELFYGALMELCIYIVLSLIIFGGLYLWIF